MKIVVTPEYLARQMTALRRTAAGLEAQRNRLARVSYPAMPPSTLRSVEESVRSAKTDLTRVGRECAAMAAQLQKRKDFHPPEGFPSFAPTAALTKDAERRAERLAKRIRDGKANIKDDIKFIEDQELQLQLALLLGDKGFERYVKQLRERFELAQDLIHERRWKERKDEEMAGYWDSHERFFGRHHLGWAYPKGFMTGVFKGGSALDASLYSLYGAIHDQFSSERKDMWKALGMPTNTEAIGQSLEFAFKNPDEFAKALVAWDTFADGRIGEGLGEVSFSALLLYGTGGMGSASTAVRSAAAARRLEMASMAAVRSLALKTAEAEKAVAALRALARDSRVGSETAGGLGRNVNFKVTRAQRLAAEAKAAQAEAFAARAALNRAAALVANQKKWAQVRLAGSSFVTSWAGLDITQIRHLTEWLKAIPSAFLTASGLRPPSAPPAPKAPKHIPNPRTAP